MHRIQSGADHPRERPQPPFSTLRIAAPQTWAIPTLMGGRQGTRYQARELLVNIHPVLQCSIPRARLKSNLAIAGADHPDQPKATHPPISTLWMGHPATPFRGAPGNRCKRATHRRHPAVQCSIQGGHDFQADFYEARRPLLWSMRNCSKTASGDSSRRYPHLRRFQRCAREKVGSGRRDLVKRSVTFLEFRVSGNPTSSLWQLN